MNILSIQSWVAYGHVGNASAVFPLQRLGAEVWAINTVQFSNHTGYGHWTGDVFTGAQVRALVDGVAARGVLGTCDAVLSGYVGDAAIGEAILDAVARVRVANPARALLLRSGDRRRPRRASMSAPASPRCCATACCRRPTSPRRTGSSWTC